MTLDPLPRLVYRTRATSAGPSLIVKHSLVLHGRKTSVTCEEAFWKQLARFARAEKVSISALVGDIDLGRRNVINLSSSIRLYVVDRLRRERLAAIRAVRRRIPVLREHVGAP